jgi:four helix bundle protein
MNSINSFKDLDAWKKSHTLRIKILRLIVDFPQTYQYGLCAQLQRSSISVGSNIAGSFGRLSIKEKINFMYYSRGLITGVQDQLIVCVDLKLIAKDQFRELSEISSEVHKLINGLMRSLRATSYEKRATNE